MRSAGYIYYSSSISSSSSPENKEIVHSKVNLFFFFSLCLVSDCDDFVLRNCGSDRQKWVKVNPEAAFLNIFSRLKLNSFKSLLGHFWVDFDFFV